MLVTFWMKHVEDIEVSRFFRGVPQSLKPCAIHEANATIRPHALHEIIGAVVGGADAQIAPGTYQIVAASVVDRLTNTLNDAGGASVQDLVFEITPERISIGFKTTGQSPVVSGRTEVVDGRLNITDIESSGGIFEFILPAETILGGFEKGFNQYLEQNGLRLVSIEPGVGVLTFVIE